MNQTHFKNRIYKQALLLAIPMMIQNGITNAVGLVDNLMVGSLGTESMTAVSISSQLIFVFNLAIFGILSGPGIYGAQYYGQGNVDGFRNVFRLKLWSALLCLMAGLGIFLGWGPNLIGLYLHGSDPGIDAGLTLKLATQYLHIMLIGLPAFSLTQVYYGSLRETEQPLKPMVAGIVSVAADVIFNYLLIYGSFGFPRLEVRGAAVATVIARYIEMLVVVLWAHKERTKHRFLIGIYRTLRIPLGSMMHIVKVGSPLFVNEFLWAGGMAALTQCYSLRGLQVIAGLNISNAICNLLNVVFIALGNACGILTGKSLGASRFEEAKSNATHLMWFSGGVCCILTAILIGLSSVFPGFYNTTDEVRELGRNFIIITACFFPINGFINALYFTLRSGGKTVITFLFDSVFTWVCPVPAAWIMTRFTSIPILTIYIIIQCMDLIKLAIGYYLMKKGIWITNLVENT